MKLPNIKTIVEKTPNWVLFLGLIMILPSIIGNTLNFFNMGEKNQLKTVVEAANKNTEKLEKELKEVRAESAKRERIIAGLRSNSFKAQIEHSSSHTKYLNETYNEPQHKIDKIHVAIPHSMSVRLDSHIDAYYKEYEKLQEAMQ